MDMHNGNEKKIVPSIKLLKKNVENYIFKCFTSKMIKTKSG